MSKTTTTRLVTLTAILFAPSCIAPTDARTDPAVAQFGAMREVMREGNSIARIRLADAIARRHAIAVGALEGLAGEITIVDGAVWVSRVGDGGELQVTGPETSAADHATLLTLSHIETWHATELKSAASGAELEALIEQAARAHGIDTSKPFPFRIEGAPRNIEMHAINGYCPIAIDPATQPKQPWRWSSDSPGHAVIVGFHAKDAVAVMTHHGTALHAHAIVTSGDRRLMGHIDHVVVVPRHDPVLASIDRGLTSRNDKCSNTSAHHALECLPCAHPDPC